MIPKNNDLHILARQNQIFMKSRLMISENEQNFKSNISEFINDR
jgi:hypothetical protein